MLKISCGTVMTSKCVTIKMHDAFGKVCGDNYVLGVFNPLWIAVASTAYVCTLERTANGKHWHARS